jgi:mannose-1-phosphate guanylyltransferase
MVQRVYRQLRAVEPKANVLVSTNDSQLVLVNKQLESKINVVLEPSRRNTFPAIVLSAAYLKYRTRLSDDEPFVVVPIDVYADLGYFECLRKMEQSLNDSDNNVVLMGVTPTYPSEKYGYIITHNNVVQGFKEKPNSEEAAHLISNGALWNCGVFAMTIGYILEITRKYIDFENYEQVLEQFDKLPSDSFDYIVLEHESKIGYVSHAGKWKDIGTWNTLTEELSNGIDPMSKSVISAECENTHVLNMLDKPIITLGLKDTVVVASNDGILIADKKASSQLKPYADKVQQRPMYEQRQWGNYRVLDYVQSANGSSLTKRLRVEAGKSISYQYHNQRSEIWVIISGEGIVTIDGVKQVVETGSVVAIPQGAKHKLAAATDVEFVEVQLGGSDLVEDDIVRT